MPSLRSREYDVIVVGARCAGATLAAYLARAGADVLLLDKDAMPSDQVLSTHNVHAAGMEVLDDLGVGDAVRADGPASMTIRLDLDGVSVDVDQPAPSYCPRRGRLDGLLQGAARRAGAVMFDQARVVSLVSDGDRVRGVRAVVGGQERELTAALVVGADGRRSTIAELTGAGEYLGYDAPRAVFWGYWNAPQVWYTDHQFDLYFGFRNGWITAVFQTDHGQLLMGSSPPADRVEAFRADPAGELYAALRGDPVARRLVIRPDSLGKVRGAVNERYFFRQAVGEGWALVGDAGVHKEFLLGDGITEALLQARLLAAAIGEGSQAALVRWWRARDVAILPLYFVGQEIGAARLPLDCMRLVFSRLESHPELSARLTAVMARQLSPFDAIPPALIAGTIADAVIHRRWDLLREITDVGGRAAAMQRELKVRRKLLLQAGGAPAASVPWRRPDDSEAAAA